MFIFSSHFCDKPNIFKGSPEELNEVMAPSPAAQYLLIPPNPTTASEMTQGLLVYCIDVSGSMGTRVHVPESQGAWLSVHV